MSSPATRPERRRLLFAGIGLAAILAVLALHPSAGKAGALLGIEPAPRRVSTVLVEQAASLLTPLVWRLTSRA